MFSRFLLSLACGLALLGALPQARAQVLSGIDVLVRDDFAALDGLAVGLVTNHTGQDRQRRATIDLLHASPRLRLVALFSPEHGIRGELDQARIDDSTDEATGLPVHSLYGERRAPDPAQLEGLDALVFDIQDIGCRFYTYISTLTLCMEQAALADLRMIVLDRPNPIGPATEGPVLTGARSFVAAHEIPLRHGMTVGELARLIDAERGFGTRLEIVRCEGWPEAGWFDRTGLPWSHPSPNMRTMAAATLYPGVGLLEFCRLSVGRGTDSPFERIGAPYLDDLRLAAELNAARPAGISFVPIRFTPEASVFAGEECGGVAFVITDREALRPLELGLLLARTIERQAPGRLGIERMDRLLGCADTLEMIRAGREVGKIAESWQPGLDGFERRRAEFLLYPRAAR